MNKDIHFAKAMAATVLFGTAGALSFFFLPGDWRNALPLALSYAVLILNTYFSIRFFSPITPPDNIPQTVVDAILAFLYLGLAVSFAHPLRFAFALLCLFLFATLKYALLRGVIPYRQTLAYKIKIDLLGALLSFAGLVFMLLGYISEGSWLLASVFACMNAYLLFLRPMYRLRD